MKQLNTLPSLITYLFAFLSTFWSAVTSNAQDSQLSAQGSNARIELGYPDKFLETPGIFHEIFRQPLVFEQWIRKAELLTAYDATDKPLQHRAKTVENVPGSYSPKVIEGSSGIMLWGPYVELPQGDYLVVYRFKVTKRSDPISPIFLDVCHNACTRSGIRLDLGKQPMDEWQSVGVPVSLTESAKLEFRFWPAENLCLVDRVYLFKVLIGPEAQKQSEIGGDLPFGRVVEGRNDVVRSPHTDDEGMIDISGLSSGTKVRCPYTGKYFRVP